MARVSRPLVVAHRGASAEIAEHTLPAYREALALGADGVECDVRLTADHHLVCVHDRRAERTSNGHGVISTLELAHLEGLDWGSWKTGGALGARISGEEPDIDPERGRLLTLRRLLETLVAEDRQVLTLVETKHPSRYGGQVERRLVGLLREFGLTTGDLPRLPAVRMMSFSGLAMRRMAQLAPRIPRIYLVEARNLGPGIRRGRLPYDAKAIGLDVQLVRRSPALVTRHLDAGHEVFVWTVNDVSDAEMCATLGVHTLITDVPGRMIAHFATSP